MSKEVQDEEMRFNVKNIISHLPLFTVLIIILGIIKQILFYTNFNLPINSFLGLSELGLIISDDLIVYVPVVLIMLSIIFYFPINNKTTIKKGQEILNGEEIDKQVKSLKKDLQRFLLLPRILLGFMLTFGIYKITNAVNFYEKIFVAALLQFFVLFAIIVFVQSYFLKHVSRHSSFVALMFFSMLITFLLIGISTEIHKVEKGKYAGTIIKTTDSTYISTDSSYFIGRTEKYLFIYNSKDSSALILPSEAIKSILIKKK